MTPNRILTLLPVLALVAHTAAPAQQVPEPRDPIVSAAPSRSEWTVRLTEQFPDGWAADNSWESQGVQNTNTNETPTIRSLTYNKDASIKTFQITTRWTDGNSEQEWIVMGQHIAERPNGGLYVVSGERLTASEIGVSDFPELVWIERKHYKGIRTYKGKQVFAFEEDFNRRRMTPTETRQFQFALQANPGATPEEVFKPRFRKVVAYVDVATQLPVLYNDGTRLRTYTFNDPGTSRLRPPQNIIDFVRLRQTALDARISPPAGPGKPDTSANR